MTELRLQIAATRRWLDEISAAADQGKIPEMADARLLMVNARETERLVWRAHIDSIQPRTPEEDRAAQKVVT